MGQTPDQLTSDIEQTRGRLGDHLDELQDKVSPSAIVGRRTQAARSTMLGVKDRALGTARSAGDSTPSPADAAASAKQQIQGAPIAAGLAAFGLGMVIAALVPASRVEQKAAGQLKDTVQEQAQPLMEDAKQAATETAQQLKQSAEDSVQQVKETGTDAAARVQDEGKSSAQSVRDETS